MIGLSYSSIISSLVCILPPFWVKALFGVWVLSAAGPVLLADLCGNLLAIALTQGLSEAVQRRPVVARSWGNLGEPGLIALLGDLPHLVKITPLLNFLVDTASRENALELSEKIRTCMKKVTT